MRKCLLYYLLTAMSLFSLSAFSQTASDSTLLGLPGDNLDLYAVLDLFQKSPTIEEFEKSLNLEKTAINNLDLDLDSKVDFIKVATKKDGDNFTFILQVAVNKSETQDVAVILVSKDKDKKITMQIVGDPDLYGKDYIVELKETVTPAVTANPAYKGTDTVIVSAPAKTTVVVVESAPIVQYVYSPVYVPYYPPYYYGYYPPYYSPFAVMSVGIYIGHHSYYHHGYGGYHGNTVVIHNTNHYNNYNNSRNRSNTVNHNNTSGNYNKGNNASTRPSTGAGASTRPSTGAGASTRPSTGGPSTGAGASTRPSTGTSPSAGQSNAGPRQSNQPSSGQSSNFNTQQNKFTSGGASQYGGGGGSRGGGGSSSRSGGSRGGGGRGGGGRR